MKQEIDLPLFMRKVGEVSEPLNVDLHICHEFAIPKFPENPVKLESYEVSEKLVPIFENTCFRFL